MWIEPIDDRTLADVNRALTLTERANRKGGLHKLSQAEQEEFKAHMKGAFDYFAANRIEGNTKHLYSRLRVLGYINFNWIIKTWNPVDYFTESELKRVRDNIYKLVDYIDFEDMRVPLNPTMKYQDINALEKALKELPAWIDKVVASYTRVSGDIVAGDIK